MKNLIQHMGQNLSTFSWADDVCAIFKNENTLPYEMLGDCYIYNMT